MEAGSGKGEGQENAMFTMCVVGLVNMGIKHTTFRCSLENFLQDYSVTDLQYRGCIQRKTLGMGLYAGSDCSL
jgi:hypothetical protein